MTDAQERIETLEEIIEAMQEERQMLELAYEAKCEELELERQAILHWAGQPTAN